MGRSEEPIKVETCYCSAVSSSGAAQLVNCFLVSTQDCVPVNVFFGTITVQRRGFIRSALIRNVSRAQSFLPPSAATNN